MSDQASGQGYDKQRSGIFNQNEYVAQPNGKGMFEHMTEGCQCEGKRCTKCEQVKCHRAFPRDRRAKSGLMAQCKECKNAYNKAQYQVQAEQRREYQKAHYYAHYERYKTYKRAHYQANREQIKVRSQNYYREHVQRYREQKKVYRQNNLERLKANDRTRYTNPQRQEWNRAWRQAHIEHVRALNRRYYYRYVEQQRAKTRRYYRAHRIQVRGYHRAYHQARPGLRALHARNRRARERQALGTLTFQQWEALKVRYDFRCLCCQRREPEIKLTIDHVVPLCKGGTNSIENIQPLCLSCNTSKRTKIIDYRKDGLS